MFAELKECFMEAYDDNKDGKIEIREVRKQTPTLKNISNFLLIAWQIFNYLNDLFWKIVNINLQLAQLLPLEESFLLLFRFDNPLESSVEFMKV